MPFLLWSAVLVASLAALIKCADIFVEQAARTARALGISDAIIGVTLVALGTSLPELAASLASVFTGAGEFAAGTVVGSNVANICLILGVAALAFRGVDLGGGILRLDLPVMMVATAVLPLMALDGSVGRLEGAFLVGMYGVYLSQTAASHREAEPLERQGSLRPIMALWLLLSAAGIYLGASYTVTAVERLSALLGLGDTSLLALTVVAVGSSLPELVVTLTAARKRYHELGVGNIVGSNICNTFLVLGVPALIQPLPLTHGVLWVGLPFMVAASLLLWVMAHTGRLGRHFGLLLMMIFSLFLLALGGVV